MQNYHHPIKCRFDRTFCQKSSRVRGWHAVAAYIAAAPNSASRTVFYNQKIKYSSISSQVSMSEVCIMQQYLELRMAAAAGMAPRVTPSSSWRIYPRVRRRLMVLKIVL